MAKDIHSHTYALQTLINKEKIVKKNNNKKESNHGERERTENAETMKKNPN